MWEIDPHCENCRTLTVLPDDVPGERTEHGKNIINPPDNMATIQHKYPRKSPNRKPNVTQIVFLWCYKCNKEDNIKHGSGQYNHKIV